MPDRFVQRWLAFDPRRPARRRLARRFVLAVLVLIAVSGMLALLTQR